MAMMALSLAFGALSLAKPLLPEELQGLSAAGARTAAESTLAVGQSAAATKEAAAAQVTAQAGDAVVAEKAAARGQGVARAAAAKEAAAEKLEAQAAEQREAADVKIAKAIAIKAKADATAADVRERAGREADAERARETEEAAQQIDAEAAERIREAGRKADEAAERRKRNSAKRADDGAKRLAHELRAANHPAELASAKAEAQAEKAKARSAAEADEEAGRVKAVAQGGGSPSSALLGVFAAVTAAPASPEHSLTPEQHVPVQPESATATTKQLQDAGCKLPKGFSDLSGDDPPGVVISGIGDSGTRGVLQLLHGTGVIQVCPLYSRTIDNTCTKGAHTAIKPLLDCAEGVVSMSRYTSPACNERFTEALSLVAEGVAMTKHCIDSREGVKSAWGFKNPRQIYLQPVLQKLYGKKTLSLMVARDPRDVCNGKNQGQWEAFGKLGKHGSCYEWWASLWLSFLKGDGAMERLAIVRIEDLVMPDPRAESQSLQSLSCVSRQIRNGIRSGYVKRELSTMHTFNDSYMGSGLHSHDKAKRERQFARACEKHPEVAKAAYMLGYNKETYKLNAPSDRRVCVE